ncbi:MAG: DUF1419 domain-containing protein [Mesorhizobium sp.]|uniref:DUF1419 domain-containing protein n=1 Tax=Mesorhizobium sp. TaxID=1871066 RepID=UPI000FE89EF1|nr:DUF1419 domain-containing protein [Mesorhizobium sp.]RWL87327.1 MAG: DUF1419 domain-containing protein [Mesorhizobium sp.]TJV70260.1 MAG: DUF1419 domain-containing protein [Mesorhizobium sp.]
MPASFRKIFENVATREQMFALFNRDQAAPPEDRISGKAYVSQWFEIEASEYHFMLDVLPPLFVRTGMFGMSEFKAGYITSVFFEITIRGRRRWFTGFCDLSDPQSPHTMREAIIAYESQLPETMTREEKLEAIWADTHPDFRGTAGSADPGGWPAEHRGKRTILVNAGGHGTVLKLLEDLTDEEIEEKLRTGKQSTGS